MRSFRSSKNPAKILAKPRQAQIAGLLTLVILLIWGLASYAYSPRRVFRSFKKTSSKANMAKTPESQVNKINPPAGPVPPGVSFSHTSITTTIFWVGETPGSDNGGISNKASTWDEQWQQHFGGVDDPRHRNGYLPAGFTPQENVFYFALPYSDITDDDQRKPTATKSPLYSSMKDQPHSWCKNAWIAIRHNGKIVYAQWEDAGPFGEDDVAYVFGNSGAANTRGEKAGLDVSPAVRDFLGLNDVDNCDWGFISVDKVPPGPWKQTITTTPSSPIN